VTAREAALHRRLAVRIAGLHPHVAEREAGLCRRVVMGDVGLHRHLAAREERLQWRGRYLLWWSILIMRERIRVLSMLAVTADT